MPTADNVTQMLELFLSTDYKPGTNLRGDLASADWRYLLPAMELRRVLLVGSPPDEMVSTLAASGSQIYIAATGGGGTKKGKNGETREKLD